jgi:hypothetical protein
MSPTSRRTEDVQAELLRTTKPKRSARRRSLGVALLNTWIAKRIENTGQVEWPAFVQDLPGRGSVPSRCGDTGVERKDQVVAVEDVFVDRDTVTDYFRDGGESRRP